MAPPPGLPGATPATDDGPEADRAMGEDRADEGEREPG